jgi:hypothetical protein
MKDKLSRWLFGICLLSILAHLSAIRVTFGSTVRKVLEAWAALEAS